MSKYLSIYLNDHLAGAFAALELLDKAQSWEIDEDIKAELASLKRDIEKDRVALESLINRLGSGESTFRKASAWITEKVAELKLIFDDPRDGQFRLFESLEALSLGIEGKCSLWRALDVAMDKTELGDTDLKLLTKRAEEQRTRVEKLRLMISRDVLTT